jgi:hypothetical protein
VVAWDVATDQIVDLGRLCENCMVAGELFLSPDGKRLAARYQDDPDGLGVAFLDQTGTWNRVPPTSDQTWSELAGWIDDTRLLIADAQGGVHSVETDTGAAEPSSCGVGLAVTLWCYALSPDRTRNAFIGQMGGLHGAIVTVMATGEQTRIPVPDPSGLYQTDMTALAWSPDSRWLALQVTDPRTDAYSLYVVPADGSAEPRPVPEGPEGPIEAWAWLPAAP